MEAQEASTSVITSGGGRVDELNSQNVSHASKIVKPSNMSGSLQPTQLQERVRMLASLQTHTAASTHKHMCTWICHILK